MTAYNKNKHFYDHCNKSRHTRETCRRLHGHLAQGRSDGGTRPRANHTSMVETSASSPDASSSSVDTLCQLMSQLETFGTASFSFPHMGNLLL